MMSKDTSSSISKKSLEIPSLKDDGLNYNAWKFRQLTILCLRSLAGFIDGTDLEPAQLTGSDANDSTKIAERAKLVKKWTARSNEAHAQIILSMEDGTLAKVIKTMTAEQAWKHVVECWEGKGMQSLMFLYHQLTTTKIEEDEDLTTGFNNLQSIASKMKTLGEPVSDPMLTQIFMKALPASYVIVSTVISSASQNSTVSSDQVMKATTTKEEH
ncbi:hypothetical protein OPQ81_000496 [Rhizoctonia solani]|nr:hypothetical protein OPQ81_000496 [Rhizoctonia solani]